MEKELRIRKGFSDNFGQGDDKKVMKINAAINDNIDNYQQKLHELVDEQYNELARKYNSLISRTKKTHEQEKAKSGDKAAEEAERENELHHHLELITNIAQRTEAENRELCKHNAGLKSKFEKQETDREYLVLQLVL